jgi:hypothetical protein
MEARNSQHPISTSATEGTRKKDEREFQILVIG